MRIDLNKIHSFLFFKLPSAWWCGVRVKSISQTDCQVTVKHRWFNQNPFNSMYFAVQNMAAELSTGVLVMQAIGEFDVPISMLVIETNSKFYKKATGRITFICQDVSLVNTLVKDCVDENNAREINMNVKAINENKDLVSEFSFKWSVKPKNI